MKIKYLIINNQYLYFSNTFQIIVNYNGIWNTSFFEFRIIKYLWTDENTPSPYGNIHLKQDEIKTCITTTSEVIYKIHDCYD